MADSSLIMVHCLTSKQYFCPSHQRYRSFRTSLRDVSPPDNTVSVLFWGHNATILILTTKVPLIRRLSTSLWSKGTTTLRLFHGNCYYCKPCKMHISTISCEWDPKDQISTLSFPPVPLTFTGPCASWLDLHITMTFQPSGKRCSPRRKWPYLSLA